MSTAQTLVKDVMSTPLVTISPNATLVEAATRMRSEKVNALLVPSTELAIVTSTDVLDAVAAERQTQLNDRDSEPGRTGHELCRAIYESEPFTYPVLTAITDLQNRLEDVV